MLRFEVEANAEGGRTQKGLLPLLRRGLTYLIRIPIRKAVEVLADEALVL